jgi:cbb3-type cytochrome oxidase subunit 1
VELAGAAAPDLRSLKRDFLHYQRLRRAHDVALVAAWVLEPIVDLHYKTVELGLKTAVETDPKMRAALLHSSQVPTNLRARFHGSA